MFDPRLGNVPLFQFGQDCVRDPAEDLYWQQVRRQQHGFHGGYDGDYSGGPINFNRIGYGHSNHTVRSGTRPRNGNFSRNARTLVHCHNGNHRPQYAPQYAQSQQTFDWNAPAQPAHRIEPREPSCLEIFFESLRKPCDKIMLKYLIYYKNEQIVVAPTSLHPYRHRMDQECSSFRSFNLPKSLIENSQQKVLIRFCRFDVSKEQDDAFPLMLKLRVNKKVFSTNLNKDSQSFGHPLDISNFVKEHNNMTIFWKPERLVNFCYTVIAAERISANLVVKQLKQTASQDADITKKLIKDIFSENIPHLPSK